MLTHPRIFEMNITICKMLQARFPLSKTAFQALQARIALFVHLLEVIEEVRLIFDSIPSCA